MFLGEWSFGVLFFIVGIGFVVFVSYVWHVVYILYKEIKFKYMMGFDDNVGLIVNHTEEIRLRNFRLEMINL